MTTDADLEETIRGMICELTTLPADQIAMSDRLRGDINLDSVTSLELLGMMEERFDLEIDVYAIVDFQTVADVFELARRHLRDVPERSEPQAHSFASRNNLLFPRVA